MITKKLNFGSGQDIKEGWDNADYDNHNGANITFDFDIFPYPIKDNTYDYVYANHVLEHLQFPKKALNELMRITKHGGIVEINVPHFNSEGAFCLEHINFWNETSFIHYCNPIGWEAKRDFKIEIVSLECTPSRFGKWIYPKILRRKVSLLLRGIYMEIKFKGRVIKNEEKKEND